MRKECSREPPPKFTCGLRTVSAMLNPQVGPPVPDSLRLHTAYRDRKLFVWGECAGHATSARHLSFGASPAMIRRAIALIVPDKIPATYREATVWVPTRDGKAVERGVQQPGPSPQNEGIRPWTVPVAIL